MVCVLIIGLTPDAVGKAVSVDRNGRGDNRNKNRRLKHYFPLFQNKVKDIADTRPECCCLCIAKKDYPAMINHTQLLVDGYQIAFLYI